MNHSDVAWLMSGRKANLVFLDPPYDFGHTEQLDDVLQSIVADTHILLMHSDKEMVKYLSSTKWEFRTFYVWNHSKHKLRWAGPLQDHILMASLVSGNPTAYKVNQDGFGTVVDVEYLATLPEEERVIAHSKSIKDVAKFIEHYSDSGHRVVDLFGGGGTSLIACEQLERRCYMMEIDAKLCDVIAERWMAFTGEEARLERAGKVICYSELTD